MEKEKRPPKKKSPWLWVLIAVGACMALACGLLVVAGGFYFRIDRKDNVSGPELPAIPSPSPTLSTNPVRTEPAGGMLDEFADPLYGSIKLQRAFSPDPILPISQAGGKVSTATLGFDCGFTTSAPTFTFSIGGGASDTFLRIFFTAEGDEDTTLVVRTPDEEWLCADDSPYGNGQDPVIDLEMGPSGTYVLWVGTWETEIYAPGALVITQSMEITP
jgi:hypothetical protein